MSYEIWDSIVDKIIQLTKLIRAHRESMVDDFDKETELIITEIKKQLIRWIEFL